MKRKRDSANLIVPVLLAAATIGALSVVVRYINRPANLQTFATGQTGTYVEDFSTTTYRDAVETSMDWNTDDGQLELARASGALTQLDFETSGKNNVTSTPAISESLGLNGIVLAAQDYPLFAYTCTDSGFVQTCVTRWDGTQFVTMDGTPGYEVVSDTADENVSDRAAVALHPTSGYPCVVYTQSELATFQLEHSCWNGSVWGGPFSGAGVSDVVTTSPSPLQGIRVQIGSDGRAVISYEDSSTVEVLVAHQTASGYEGYLAPTPDVIASGINGALDLDADNEPHILFNQGDDVYYTQFASGTYRELNGISAGANAITASAAAYGVSMQLGSDGRPRIAYQEVVGLNDTRAYFTRWDGSALIGSAGEPGATEVLSGFINAPVLLSLASDDRPTVCADRYNDDLGAPTETYCTVYAGSQWVSPVDFMTPGDYNITQTPDQWEFAWAMLVDSNDDVIFSMESEDGGGFNDVQTGILVRPRLDGVAQSVEIDSTSDNITSATLSAMDTSELLNGGTLTYEFSNDGTTFFPVALGGTVNFSTSGSNLEWRVTGTGNPDDVRFGSMLSSLAISYTYGSSTPEPSPEPGNTRISGETVIEQAINTSRERFADGAALAVVLSRADKIVDALVGAPLASASSAPILLTETQGLPPEVLQEIQRVLTSTSDPIYVLGLHQAVSENVVAQLSAAGFETIVRIGDQDRRGTAARIADHLIINGLSGSSVALTEDERFADTLGFSAVAAQRQGNGAVIPILLTERGSNTLNAHAQDVLKDNAQFTTMMVVGGTKAVSADVALRATTIAPHLQTIKRFDGVDRYATNVSIAEGNFAAPSTIVVSGGEQASLPGALAARLSSITGETTFYSALLGGTYAADQNAPLLITQATVVPDVVLSYLTSNAATIERSVVIGSTAQVSEAVQAQIESAI